MADSKARLNFMNWHICAVHTATRKPTLRITDDDLQKTPLIHGVLLHDV
jgi:hypothetical protein